MNEYSTKLNFFRFPPILEFTLIISISLGYFIISSFQWATLDTSGPITLTYGDSQILQIIYYEFIVLLIVISILKWQGRSFNFGFSFSIDKITMGLVLFIANYFLYIILFRLLGDYVLGFNLISGESSQPISYSVNISAFPLLLFSVFNPLFEEFILVGYVVTAIRKKFGLLSCLILSVGFRLSFHIYQGPIILLSILPMGILFTLYFWRKRTILPLIIAHGLMDFLSFVVFMQMQNN
jgi:CAAX protease family protein